MAMCIVFAFMYVFLNDLQYDTNDDTMLNMIAVGAFGPMSQCLLYINVLYGFLLKGLYAVVPYLNWYVVLFLVFNCLSVMIIILTVTDRIGVIQTLLVTILFHLLMYEDLYIRIQFTKNAFFYAIAGFCLLLMADGCRMGKKYILLWIAGAFMITLSALIRWRCTMLVMPFGVAALLYRALCDKGESTPAGILKRIKVLAVPVILCIAVVIVDYVYYMNLEEVRNYRQRFDVISRLLDYGELDYERYKDDYEAAGIHESEIKMLQNWVISDVTYMTTERLELIESIKSQDEYYYLRRPTRRILLELSHDMMEVFRTRPISVFWIGLMLFSVLYMDKNRRILQFVMTLVIVAEYYYLFCGGRVIWRVELGIWLSAICMFFSAVSQVETETDMQIKEERGKFSASISALIVLGGLILITFGNLFVFHDMKNNQFVTEWGNYHTFFEAVREEKTIYVGELRYYLGYAGAKGIFDIDKKYDGLYHNFIFLGGWTTRPPVGTYYAKQAGIDNPVSALLEREDVYFAGKEDIATIILEYLEDTRQEEIIMEQAESVGGRQIWKYRVKE